MSSGGPFGIHAVIRTSELKDYFTYDDEFKEVYDSAESRRENVKIAVVDEGVHQDDGLPGVPRGGYLSSRCAKHVVSSGIAPFDEKQISHGTRVGAVACWGWSGLKLLDYRVRTQAAIGSIGAREAEKEVPLVKTAMEAAIKDGASVVVSALATENKKNVYKDNGVDKLIVDNPGVLFVFGAGNNGRDLDKYDVCPGGLGPAENMVVVGGCSSEFKTSAKPDTGGSDINFGYGAKSVDVASYADNLTLYDPGMRHYFAKEANVDLSGLGLVPTSDTGVSFAIPQVANVCAKMLAINSHLGPKDVKGLVRSTGAVEKAGLAAANVTKGIIAPGTCYLAAVKSEPEK
ncbi:MAG: S8 family serine peptidase [Nitrososphaerota archaeon]|nr:S8 family serine peptidase [Nitrososphaerota archaeon]MDG6966906.1 S8 family serine peptidase [Nitrososphaerota archaeon]MDG6978710.1 S8 family serine peptidase [Nitrososphaerota archaeon]